MEKYLDCNGNQLTEGFYRLCEKARSLEFPHSGEIIFVRKKGSEFSAEAIRPNGSCYWDGSYRWRGSLKEFFKHLKLKLVKESSEILEPVPQKELVKLLDKSRESLANLEGFIDDGLVSKEIRQKIY